MGIDNVIMDDDTYNPVKPTYYKYRGADFLTSESDQPLDHCNNIYICAYDVNTDGVTPFLRFLLTKPEGSQDNLRFPVVLRPIGAVENHEYINYVSYLLLALLSQNGNKNPIEDITFTGYYSYNSNMYMFYDITKIKFRPIDNFMGNSTWLALVDEIITHQHVCNMRIDDDTANFMILNDAVCFLMDETGRNYEIPIVCYVGKPTKQLSFTCTFGESRSNKNSILGPFYYFLDFFTAFKGSLVAKRLISFDNAIEEETGGLVRFAAFLGATKFIENNPTDPIDTSDIKQQRLEDGALNVNQERLTMRISDHDGTWSQKYDSAFLGDPELDDGSRLNIKLLAVKEYNQQVPLSYHYINNITLKYSDKFFAIM
jgi:hypothetical protein